MEEYLFKQERVGLQGNKLLNGVDLVVGTPGRVFDCIERRLLSLEKCSTVVIDECDKMISDGLVDTLDMILATVPPESKKSTNQVKY